MIMLLVLIVLCFLVPLFYFLGPIVGLGVLLGLALLTPIIIYQVLKRKTVTTNASGGATTSNTEPGKGLGWLIKLAVVAGILYWGIPWAMTQYRGYKAIQLASRAPAVPVITPAEQWVFEWQLPPETYVRGLNRSGPVEATIEKRDNEKLWIILTYVEYGKTEKTTIHLGKVTNGAWDGFWEQSNPKDSGRCNLHEVGTDSWAGTMTGTAGIPAFCTLKKK